MATTFETQTRTRTDRYGGYQYGMSFDTEENNQSFVELEENQDAAFEVQQNYTFGTDDDITREEQTRVMAMPNVERRAHVVSAPESTAKIKIRARGKIAITVYSIILVALITFAIYNAVAIGALKGEVDAKNQTYISQLADINALQVQYNELGLDETIMNKAGENGFIQSTENDIVRVSKVEMDQREETEVETNWFEDLCQFLSGLFK
ncbi:MAG: hypothetical protein IJW24_04215 [Clostridia bacterium]|nr:hypothetical protein [Clostridia bacterium]